MVPVELLVHVVLVPSLVVPGRVVVLVVLVSVPDPAISENDVANDVVLD